jgi:hypothetical protein
MSKEFLTALLCGFAITGQICAQEVIVAREAKTTVTPVSKGRDSESETATEVRAKKSAPHALTVEQMRMAGALAAERQKNQRSAEPTSSVPGTTSEATKSGVLAAEQQKTGTRLEQTGAQRGPNSHTTKSTVAVPVRPTMIDTGKQESPATQPAKAEVRGGQTNVPQSANRALRKKEPIASSANSPDGDSALAQSVHSEHLSSRDQETTKEKTAKGTRTVAHYSYKTPEGKKESAPVITHYYPKRIVYPFAKIDRHIDGKLMQAATIAQERAHAHSRSMCWHYVKEALLASGVIDSRPKSELAKDAAQDLVSNYGFKKLPVGDPFAAPVGSVLVYGANRAAGHVEIRTRDGFVSDFYSKTPSPRPLLGVYAKL